MKCPECHVRIRLRKPPTKEVTVRLVCPRCGRRFMAKAGPGLSPEVRETLRDIMEKFRDMAEK